MKLKNTHLIALVCIVLLIADISFAQGVGRRRAQNLRGRGRMMNLNRNNETQKQEQLQKLNLTDEQKEKLNELRVKFQKENIKIKSDLQIKNIELRELKRKETSDLGPINKKIDEIAAIKAQLQKNAVECNKLRMDLYTPEQKEILKTRKQKMRGFRKLSQRRWGDGNRGMRSNRSFRGRGISGNGLGRIR